ncbi:MAG: DUF4185 domain-containing protein [Thermodesulfobacteriota bacterium]
MPKDFVSRFRICLLIAAILVCRPSCRYLFPEAENRFIAESWPAADGLFRTDPHWLGGDGAGSIDLGNGRILWLFGDSLIEPLGRRGRDEATMVRNSIAIQRGYDPTRAGLHFFWGRRDAGPDDFFRSDEQGNWFWPGHGVSLGEKLLLFLMKIGLRDDGFFEAVGWKAVLVENPHEAPSDWRLSWPAVSPNRIGVIVGSAAVVREGDYVIAYGARSAELHPVFLVRWRTDSARQGDLSAPQWFRSDTGLWVGQKEFMKRPIPVFDGGQMEFSVHYDPRQQQYLQVQTMSFWNPDIVVRRGREVTGPWSRPLSLFQPPESGRKGLVVYAAKAHPELSGADLIMTYAVNTFEKADLHENADLYYPKFVKLTWNNLSD